MKVWVLTTDDYNECDNGCYSESLSGVFSTKEKAEEHVNKCYLRKNHYTIHEEHVL